MNRNFYAFAAGCISIISIASAQSITTSGSLTPSQLVQNVLMGGGITASNITYTGYANGIGKFDATAPSGLGFTSGIYMTTGSILQNDPNGFGGGEDGPAGPSSNFQSVSQSFMTASGDPDLDAMLQQITGDPFQTTNDASVLEFDFVPQSDSVFFRYRFGSEEYNDFVNSGGGGGVNDVFAFYLTGVTTPLAQTNIALLPNGTPVSIFTVNNGYSAGASAGPCTNCSFYVDNVNGSMDIVYDGMTAILTAKAGVVCGETYHIKIAIADASDDIYDSGVFLEAGSFSSNGGLQLSSSVQFGGNDTTLIEGCSGAVIGVKRIGNNSSAQTVNYALSGTATQGTDYPAMSGTVSFAAGVDSVAIPIMALLDGIPDAGESIILTVTTTNSCGIVSTESITLYISEAPPVTVDAGNDVVTTCEDLGDGVTFNAVAGGGVAPLSYVWDNGATSSSITVTSGGNTTFYVTVTDACNTSTAVDSVALSVENASPLFITASNDTLICPGEIVQLMANAVGGNGAITYEWSTGSTSQNISVEPAVTTSFDVTATDACGISASETVLVEVSPVHAAFNYAFTPVDGEVIFTNLSTGNIVSDSWSFGDGGTSTDESPSYIYYDPGDYPVTLIVANDQGCPDSVTIVLPIIVNAFVFIPNSFTPNADGINEFFTVHGNGFKKMRMHIFDRWGNEIFSTADADTGWNGYDHTAGKLYPLGVYTYRIDLLTLEGIDQTYRGHVNLIR